jgi:hypothetical protein
MIVDIVLDGKPFQIDCNYTPASKGSRNSDGVPEEPDTEAELEILAIRDAKLRSMTNFIRDFAPTFYERMQEAVLKEIEKGGES